MTTKQVCISHNLMSLHSSPLTAQFQYVVLSGSLPVLAKQGFAGNQGVLLRVSDQLNIFSVPLDICTYGHCARGHGCLSFLVEVSNLILHSYYYYF